MIKEHKNIYPEQPRRELSCYVLLHNNTGDKHVVNTSYVQARQALGEHFLCAGAVPRAFPSSCIHLESNIHCTPPTCREQYFVSFIPQQPSEDIHYYTIT